MLYPDVQPDEDEVQSVDSMFEERIIRFDDLNDEDPDDEHWWDTSWRES